MQMDDDMVKVNDAALLAELLGAIVYERSELVWIAPYSEEADRRIVHELLVARGVSSN